MTKLKVALDIDDTLFSTTRDVFGFLNKELNKNISFSVLSFVSIEDAFSLSRESFLEYFARVVSSEDYLEKNNLVPGLKKNLEELTSKYELFFMTSRSEKLDFYTRKKLFPYFGRGLNIFYEHSRDDLFTKSKRDFCLDVSAHFFIDDIYSHVLSVKGLGVESHLFSQAWNRWDRLPEGVYRFRDWNQILNYLRGLK